MVEKNSNIKLNIENLSFKTGFIPSVAIASKNLSVENKLTNSHLLSIDNSNIEIAILPLILKEISIKHFYADNINIIISQNDDGSFNFENLLKKNNKKPVNFHFNDAKLKVNGVININNSKSDFNLDFIFSYPFSINKQLNSKIKGSAYLYNLNLTELNPALKKIIPSIKNTGGLIDYIQISTETSDSKTTGAVINAKFNNLLYDQKNWKNYIYAKGENIVNSNISLFDRTIKINRFKYNADKVDIGANGTIELTNKPFLDIDVEVKNSRTENIASLLPPNLVKETMIIEKVKTYGIYGDMEGKVNIKGEVPQPNFTGFAKGKNLNILDEHTRKLHNGTVDIIFDNRKLHMDILLNMPNGQNAKIKGTTYIFRDGINDVTIKTTDKLDFPLAQKLVLPIAKVFDFQLGPLPDMNITSGKGMIDVHIRGSLEMIDLDGYCKFDDASFTYNGLFGNITNVKGRLDLKEDNIKVTSDKAYIQNNPFSIDGIVKINNNLNFNVSTKNAKSIDLLKIINNSEVLKDVKNGLLLFKNPSGKLDLSFNIGANIVPVPFGQPPLPPEEAFTDIKVKGSVGLNNIDCFLDGFKHPLEKIHGTVNFTETNVNFKNLYAKSGVSPVYIDGEIITDIKTKIPDVNLKITSNSIKFGDTIRFLADSYLYPKDYPNISSLYDLDVKHDLFLSYKAKSKDLLPNKIYAVMNIIKNSGNNNIKANSGKIILNNSVLNIQNINADIFDSAFNISGIVKDTNTAKPVYDLKINADEFNIENLNKVSDINIIPNQLHKILDEFSDYKGSMNLSTMYKNNTLNTIADFKGLSFIHKASSMPILFDDFTLNIKNDKLSLKNTAVNIGSVPLFANLEVSHIYKIPYFDGYVTSKLNNDFIKSFLPQNISNKIKVNGDINVSSNIKGTAENFEIKPQITLFPQAYAVFSGVKIADSAEKRIFEADINIKKDIINIKNVDYYKYITTQNDTVYPALFAYGGGVIEFNDKTNQFEPRYAYMKTEKSLSAKLLNAFMDKPLFKQGTITCDLKYQNDKIDGILDAKNIDLPIVDTVIKSIKLNTDNENINVRLFGFVNDSVVRAETVFDNDTKKRPHIDILKIYADKIDVDKLLTSISNVRTEFDNLKLRDNSPDLSLFVLDNGELNIDELTIKNFKAENLKSNFSIDKEGIFDIKNINVKLAEGSADGEIIYNLKNSDMTAEIELKNVDSNNLAENLFDAKNQIYGIANANFIVKTKGNSADELINNLSGFAYFDIADGKMPKLGSLEYLLRASNIVKSGVTGFSINNVLELLNLVKTGYFTTITGSCKLNNGLADNIEIFSKGENLSLYLHGDYNITNSNANMEILGKLSNKISTIFGPIGNTSLNTFFKLIPGISLLDFGRKDFINNVEKIPSFTGGEYESRTFQAIIKGDINSSGYVQSFKWVK